MVFKLFALQYQSSSVTLSRWEDPLQGHVISPRKHRLSWDKTLKEFIFVSLCEVCSEPTHRGPPNWALWRGSLSVVVLPLVYNLHLPPPSHARSYSVPMLGWKNASLIQVAHFVFLGGSAASVPISDSRSEYLYVYWQHISGVKPPSAQMAQSSLEVFTGFLLRNSFCGPESFGTFSWRSWNLKASPEKSASIKWELGHDITGPHLVCNSTEHWIDCPSAVSLS